MTLIFNVFNLKFEVSWRMLFGLHDNDNCLNHISSRDGQEDIMLLVDTQTAEDLILVISVDFEAKVKLSSPRSSISNLS